MKANGVGVVAGFAEHGDNRGKADAASDRRQAALDQRQLAAR
jgi:hypothetical protein